MEGDDVTYLEAARTVDERAHSDAATAAFRAALGIEAGDDRVSVLEAGAGTCGMLRRLLGDDALPAGEWVAVDTDDRALSAGRERLCAEATATGYRVETNHDGDDGRDGDAIELRRPDREATLRVRFAVADARAVADDLGGGFDGVVARSFADLLAPEEVLDLLRTAAPDGWYHLPLTFDGETRFAPLHPTDGTVIDAFHGTMRNHGRAATLLAERFAEAGSPATVDARADWVVEGDERGGYPAEEATFLRVVLDTVVASVRESGVMSEATLADWRVAREAQLKRGELGYAAVNRDLFGRVP